MKFEILQTSIFNSTIESGVILKGKENLSFFQSSLNNDFNYNRNQFLQEFNIRQYHFQNQIHKDNILVINESNYNSKGLSAKESDAVITNLKGILLGVSIADCLAILIHDEKKNVIAAVHSGWRGTYLNIVSKTLNEIKRLYKSSFNDLKIFISPGASVKNYEVGKEFLELFPNSTCIINNKIYYDNLHEVKNQLLKLDILENQIEPINECTIENYKYHSFRRDGKNAGRMLAYIVIK